MENELMAWRESWWMGERASGIEEDLKNGTPRDSRDIGIAYSTKYEV